MKCKWSHVSKKVTPKKQTQETGFKNTKNPENSKSQDQKNCGDEVELIMGWLNSKETSN
jgi:hypothetical protein